MAQARPNRREPENMAEFVARRARETVARVGQTASALAHDGYGKAIRGDLDLRLPTTDDVMAFGAHLMGQGDQTKPPSTPSARQAVARREPAPIPQRRRPAHPPALSPGWLEELNRDPRAKAAAGYVGMVTGYIPGAARGLKNIVDGTVEAAQFANRALNPVLDYATSAPGERTSDQVLRAGLGAADYVRRIWDDPGKLETDARRAARQINVDLNPFAKPTAETAVGEFRRLHNVAKNQGELALNVALFPVANEAMIASGIGRAGRFAKATNYLMPHNGDAALYLAKLYEGMGHHAILPRDAKLPKWLGGAPIPKSIVDSPLNVVQFRGLTQGEAYAKHAMIDKHYYGSGLPKTLSRRGWSAKKAGIDTQSGLEQIWNGTPEATKSLLGGVGGGAGGITREADEDERRTW